MTDKEVTECLLKLCKSVEFLDKQVRILKVCNMNSLELTPDVYNTMMTDLNADSSYNDIHELIATLQKHYNNDCFSITAN